MKLTEQMRVAPFESEQDSWEFYLDLMHCGEAMMSKMSTMISSYCCLALEAGSARGLEEFLDTIIDKQMTLMKYLAEAKMLWRQQLLRALYRVGMKIQGAVPLLLADLDRYDIE